MLQPKQTLIASLFLILISCSPKPVTNNENTNKQTVDSLKVNKSKNVVLKYAEPYSLNNGCVLIPVILKEIYMDKGMSDNSYSNILFIKPDQSVVKLDSLKDFFIDEMYVFKPENEEENRYVEGYDVRVVPEQSILLNYILLKLKGSDFKTDSNNLSKTNQKSNSVLALVKADGSGFKYLTPLDADLKTFSFNAISGIVVSQFAFDSNKNDGWDEKDEIKISSCFLNANSKSISVVDSVMQKELLREYERKLKLE